MKFQVGTKIPSKFIKKMLNANFDSENLFPTLKIFHAVLEIDMHESFRVHEGAGADLGQVLAPKKHFFCAATFAHSSSKNQLGVSILGFIEN